MILGLTCPSEYGLTVEEFLPPAFANTTGPDTAFIPLDRHAAEIEINRETEFIPINRK